MPRTCPFAAATRTVRMESVPKSMPSTHASLVIMYAPRSGRARRGTGAFAPAYRVAPSAYAPRSSCTLLAPAGRDAVPEHSRQRTASRLRPTLLAHEIHRDSAAEPKSRRARGGALSGGREPDDALRHADHSRLK